MIISSTIIGIGVGFIDCAKLGSDSMTTLEIGFSKTFNISLSLAALIANFIFVVLLFIFDKNRVNIDTCLTPLFISMGIKIFSLFNIDVNTILTRYLCLILGIILVGLGIGIGTLSMTGSNPFDGFVMMLADKLNKDYGNLRLIFDVSLLAVGILLKGDFGVGTIVASLFQGHVAELFIKIIKGLKI